MRKLEASEVFGESVKWCTTVKKSVIVEESFSKS